MSEQIKAVTPKIFAAIAAVMGEVGAIEKGRKNEQQKYFFRGIDDVFYAFQPILARHKLFYVPEVLEKSVTERESSNNRTLIYTTLTIAYTFFAEDGSSVRAVVVGEAMDSGDKSTNKAMSAALKYCLLQMFCVPTEANEDADAESHEVKKKASTARTQQLHESTRPQAVEQRQESSAAGDGGEKGFSCPLGLVDAFNKAITASESAGITKAEWRALAREVLEMDPSAHLDVRDLDGPQMSKVVNAMTTAIKAKKQAAGAAR